eukprot:11482-Heterococcus_DN1.PRE.1
MSRLASRTVLLDDIQLELIEELEQHLIELCKFTKRHRNRNVILRFLLSRAMTTRLNAVILEFKTTMNHLQSVLMIATHSVTLDTNEQVHSTTKGLSAVMKILRKIYR